MRLAAGRGQLPLCVHMTPTELVSVPPALGSAHVPADPCSFLPLLQGLQSLWECSGPLCTVASRILSEPSPTCLDTLHGYSFPGTSGTSLDRPRERVTDPLNPRCPKPAGGSSLWCPGSLGRRDWDPPEPGIPTLTRSLLPSVRLPPGASQVLGERDCASTQHILNQSS